MILYFSAILTICLATLKVVEPVGSPLYNHQMEYGIANFGDIPYGKSITGYVQTYDTINLCQVNQTLKDSNVILLASTGSCSYVKKAVQAQTLGAKALIIIDDIAEHKKIIMSDDGSGRQVHIPTLFISSKNGDLLKAQIDKTNIKMTLAFQVNKTDRVELKLWLAANTRETYVFIRQFAPYYERLKGDLSVELIYYTQTCKGCPASDCYAGYKSIYCLTDFIGNRAGVGSIIIQQQFRQYALSQMNLDSWFKYMDSFDDNFLDWLSAATTSKTVMQQLNIDYTSTQKIVKGLNAVELMAKWRADLTKAGITNIPDATINSINYEGNMVASDIAEATCASLNNPPSICSEFFELSLPPPSKQTNLWTVVGYLIISSFLVAAVGLLICIMYKRLVRRQITNEMSSKITQNVTQYMTLVSEHEKKNKQKQVEMSRDDL